MSTQLIPSFLGPKDTPNTLQRHHIVAQGQVQGVGFRPFVYRIALEHALTGHVSNTAQGVDIEVQGTAQALGRFIVAFKEQLPPLAELTHFATTPCALIEGETKFTIIHSQETRNNGQHGHSVLISPDVALCKECAQDMANVHNRRHLYPFTNCTNCGPRYTITHSIPYDRATTSMACFPLCPSCQEEYDNPLDRRFHAQPNACPTCGPKLWYVETHMLDHDTRNAATCDLTLVDKAEHKDTSQHALELLAHALLQGKIAAIKGLGGFHLACNAFDTQAVARLRMLKNRPHKPFAVMVENCEVAKSIAHISSEEEALLTSKEKPIVLCRRHEAESLSALPESLAPDTDTLGLVLPYTPLHAVLFTHLKQVNALQTEPHHPPLALVMTSGNAGGEPICLGNREALQRLQNIADVFLLHNRDILVRNDDSVCALYSKTPQAQQPSYETVFLRRARGFVPRPIALSTECINIPCAVGMGAELKSTVCLTRGNTAFVSQHIGDLQNLETLAFYREVLAHMEMLLQVHPQCLVHDAHPDFLSTRVAQELAAQRNIPCYALHHHYAHAYAILAEHHYNKPCLALSLDGTGLGDDGSIWGGELLYIDGVKHKRLGRLSPFALAGGEQAIKEPWRIALALAQGSTYEASVKKRYGMADAVLEMLRKNIRSPLCSSAGRLFDGVAASLGLCDATTYEGQAAIRLEQIQKNMPWTEQELQNTYKSMPWNTAYEHQGLWELSSQALFTQALEDAVHGTTATAARNFHKHLAEGFCHMASLAARKTGINVIALSGGVVQNATLRALLHTKLTHQGFTVLTSKQLPCHDGSISLGQAYYGLQILQKK